MAMIDDIETNPIRDPFEDKVCEATGEQQTPEREVDEPAILL
jgi:hypothetical protein